MSGLKIIPSSGIAPKVSSRALPDGMAQIADNCRLISGSLRAFSDKLAIATNALRSGGDVKTIFRMTDGIYDYWLSWLTDVDVVRSQIAGDTEQRIYWTGDNEPRESNLALAKVGGGVMPNSCYVLGVTTPVAAPTVGVTGGTAPTVTRAYVETFVTAWGEESAPSPAGSYTGNVNGTWNLTALNAAPPNSYAISAASWSGGTLSLTFDSVIGLRVGENVTVSLLAPASLNVSMKVASINTGTKVVGFTVADPGTITDQVGTATRDAPHNTTGMKRRIYRTLSGEYFFVVEQDVATTTYNDTIADTALGELIPSIGWIMPPATLKGLISLPNGSNAGFDGNEVCFSEPWYPHAWPSKYRLAANYDVIGIGAFGSSIAVGTKGVPSIITGSHPDYMSMEKTESAEPCISKRGMVDIGVGELYPSPNGMVLVGVGGVNVITKQLYSRDEWQLINPSSLRCVFHNGMVFGWRDEDVTLHTGFAFDPNTGSLATITMPTTASYVDPETNKLYVVIGGHIYQWDAHPYNDLTFDWKSKVYSLPRPVNYGYAQVDADFQDAGNINAAIAADTAYNAALLAAAGADPAYQDTDIKGTLDAHMLDEFTLDGSMLRGGSIAEFSARGLRLTIIADGVERYTETILNGKSFSLPSGFKANLWEFRIGGNIQAFSVSVAESATELRSLA